MNFAEIRRLIEQYSTVTLFRHAHPDCDALGSQYALKTWISENYPDKKVYALGSETTAQADFPPSDEVSDAVIAESLAIVTDTANVSRTDDLRFQNAAFILKIDHHPNVELFGDASYVDHHSAAACEILADMFLSFPDRHLSLKTAEYLYMGMVTDTLCFRTPSTTGKTLRMAGELADMGIDIAVISRRLFDKSYQEFHTANYIRSHVKRNKRGNIASVILTMKDLADLHETAPTARNFIDEIGHVRDFDIWMIFTEREPDVFDGSLRSKKIPINGIAAQYHGGGHACASGVKDLSRKEIDELTDAMDRLAAE